jgi:hypothetical protein
MGALVLGACKKEEKPAATGPAPAANAPAPLPSLGTADPWAKPSPEAKKAFADYLKFTRSKKAEDARHAIDRAVELAPDMAAYRDAQLNTVMRTGDFRHVPAVFEQVAMRSLPDALAFLARVKKKNTPFAKAPEMEQCEEIVMKYRKGWTAGLDKGFLFVARDGSAGEPRFDERGEGVLSGAQRVYLNDLEAKRFRPLTAGSDRAFALHRSPDGKTLSVLVAHALHRENQVDTFVDPSVLVVSLPAFETVGPFEMKGRYDQVVLGSNAAGQPLVTFTVGTGKSETYTIDTAKTGLAHLEGASVLPTGDETRAWPNQVAHIGGKEVPDVKIADGANTFTIQKGAETIPVTAARPIAQSSLDWSPGKVKLTYAGKLDACRILKSGTAEKNELYVYDLQKRSAQRVSAAVSQFETLWLDDDRLVYEGGVGAQGLLHLYAFTAHADTTLPTRYGAGLYGVPTLQCEQAETGVDEDLGATDEEGD